MAALKLYPVGIQTFERIRKEDKLYHFSMAGGKHMEKEQLQRYFLFILQKNVLA